MFLSHIRQYLINELEEVVTAFKPNTELGRNIKGTDIKFQALFSYIIAFFTVKTN